MAKTQKTRGGRPVPEQTSSPMAAANSTRLWEGAQPANPPRKRPVLLAVSIGLFIVWLIVLAYFALS